MYLCIVAFCIIMFISTHASKYAYLYVCYYEYKFVFMFVFLYDCIAFNVYVCLFICICMAVCMYACILACIFVLLCRYNNVLLSTRCCFIPFGTLSILQLLIVITSELQTSCRSRVLKISSKISLFYLK